jgi:micrococcal nuclease
VSAPIEPAAAVAPPVEPAGAAVGFAAVSDGPTSWVPPVEGACPDGYPIKANDNSGIFHVPGGRFYNRTVPERCYANADAALADGYRRAKA